MSESEEKDRLEDESTQFEDPDMFNKKPSVINWEFRSPVPKEDELSDSLSSKRLRSRRKKKVVRDDPFIFDEEPFQDNQDNPDDEDYTPAPARRRSKRIRKAPVRMIEEVDPHHSNFNNHNKKKKSKKDKTDSSNEPLSKKKKEKHFKKDFSKKKKLKREEKRKIEDSSEEEKGTLIIDDPNSYYDSDEYDSDGKLIKRDEIKRQREEEQRMRRRMKRKKNTPQLIKKYQPVPVDENGNVIFPIQLRGLTIKSLGKIVWDKEKFHAKRYIWPVGFQSSRIYSSMTSLDKKCLYTSEIKEKDGEPCFVVTCWEDENNPTVISRPTASGAWAEVGKKFFELKKEVTGKDTYTQLSGPEMFGFAHPTIAKLIQEMDGAEKCDKYIPQQFVPATAKIKSMEDKAKKKRQRTQRKEETSSEEDDDDDDDDDEEMSSGAEEPENNDEEFEEDDDEEEHEEEEEEEEEEVVGQITDENTKAVSNLTETNSPFLNHEKQEKIEATEDIIEEEEWDEVEEETGGHESNRSCSIEMITS